MGLGLGQSHATAAAIPSSSSAMINNDRHNNNNGNNDVHHVASVSPSISSSPLAESVSSHSDMYTPYGHTIGLAHDIPSSSSSQLSQQSQSSSRGTMAGSDNNDSISVALLSSDSGHIGNSSDT
jgi:hypothetical protein